MNEVGAGQSQGGGTRLQRYQRVLLIVIAINALLVGLLALTACASIILTEPNLSAWRLRLSVFMGVAVGVLPVLASVGLIRRQRWGAIFWLIAMGTTVVIIVMRSPVTYADKPVVTCIALIGLVGAIWACRVLTREHGPLRHHVQSLKQAVGVRLAGAGPSGNRLVRAARMVEAVTDELAKRSTAWARGKTGMATLASLLAIGLITYFGREQYIRSEAEKDQLDDDIGRATLWLERAKRIAPDGDADLSKADLMISLIEGDLSKSKLRFISEQDVAAQLREYLVAVFAKDVSIRDLTVAGARDFDFYRGHKFVLHVEGSADEVIKSLHKVDEGHLVVLWMMSEDERAKPAGLEHRFEVYVFSLNASAITDESEVNDRCVTRDRAGLALPWLEEELDQIESRHRGICGNAMANPMLYSRLKKIAQLRRMERQACDLANDLLREKYRVNWRTEMSYEEFSKKLCSSDSYGSMWYELWRDVP